MRILLFMGISGAMASGRVPLIDKPVYGRGMWVSIGTPATDYFVTPDFRSGESKLFAQDGLCLVPYFPDVAPSTSLKRARGVIEMFTETIRIGNTEFPKVPMTFTGPQVALLDRHSQSCQGRLGLGPSGSFAKKKVIHVDPESIELIEAIPAVPDGVAMKQVRIVGRDDGWFIRGTLRVNDRDGSDPDMQLAVDPTISDLLGPQKAVQKIAVILNLKLHSIKKQTGISYPDVTIDSVGRVIVPCELMTQLLTDFSFSVGRDDMIRLALAAPHAHGGRSDENPRLCRTAIRVNADDGYMMRGVDGTPSIDAAAWKISPFLFEGMTNVFFNSRRYELVLTGPLPSARGPMVGPTNALHIPLYSSTYEFAPSRTESIIKFVTVPDADPRTPRYVLNSRFPVQGDAGRFTITFARYGGTDFVETSSETLPGLYEITTPFMVRSDPDTYELAVPIVPAKPSRSGRKYTVSVERSNMLMFVMLTPAGKKVHDIHLMEKDLSAITKDLGNLRK